MSVSVQNAAVCKEAPTRFAIRSVLYATDFSAQAAAVFPYALNIARMYEAELVIVHVLPPAPFDPQGGYLVTPDQLQKNAKHELKQLGFCAGRVRHRLVLREGDACKTLQAFMKEEKTDLLVLGTHGRTGAEKLLLGSVAEQILRKADCPVLTVGPNALLKKSNLRMPGVGARSILFATDFSHESLTAAPLALSMAQEHQARLTLLHVIERMDHEYMKDPERVLAYLRSELGKLVPEDVKLWCEPEYLIEFGDVAERILETGEAMNAGMIVLGVRSPGSHIFAATHLPYSTVHKVIVTAACPVLTVLG